MKTQTPTPGPYHVDPTFDVDVLTADKRIRIIQTTNDPHDTKAERIANARLLARIDGTKGPNNG